MTEIASFEAKSHFSELLRRVTREGEKFTVTVRGKPVAVLGPIQGATGAAADLSALLNELREFRAKVSARGPILQPGETWNDFAREGSFSSWRHCSYAKSAQSNSAFNDGFIGGH